MTPAEASRETRQAATDRNHDAGCRASPREGGFPRVQVSMGQVDFAHRGLDPCAAVDPKAPFVKARDDGVGFWPGDALGGGANAADRKGALQESRGGRTIDRPGNRDFRKATERVSE